MLKPLFKTFDDNLITAEDFFSAMKKVGAADAEILFIHFGMTFGTPNTELKRDEILGAIYSAIQNLGVKTIIFPTFTFSFPNGKDYNVAKSKSKMGALNEYVRRRPEAVRSIDPLMSVTLVGDKKYLATEIGHESCGKDCIFDLLRKESGVKFLFLGTSPAECFTYTHYIEWALNVPYRYNRQFTGKIITPEKTYEDTYTLFVRYEGVIPGANDFQPTLLNAKVALKENIGDAAVYCVDEKPVFNMLRDKINNDINYMLARPFPKVLKNKFVLTEEMVAL